MMHEAIITVHDGFVLTPAPPFAAIAQGVMPATTGYFAWGCFPYFSWEREPPRPQVVANGKSGQPGRFEEDGEGSAAVGKGGSLAASLTMRVNDAVKPSLFRALGVPLGEF